VERLGDFEIEGVLGEGGSGIVYAARRDGEEVALKVLRPELTLSEREVDAFLAEAQRAQRVTHPSLVEIRGAGVLPDGRPYLAMPRLHGECLAARVARGPIELERALRLFEGIVGAVSALHTAGLVHRDIKPENLFVVGDGDEHLVLLDLGIARDIDAPASTTTQAGLVRGTPAYMAPERFFGARASTLTDTYEAAVTLYVMLTGRLPWDAQDARGRMSPRDPRTVVALPEPVAKALLRALAIDETARPGSVRALHDELEQAAISTADTKLLVVSSGAPLDAASRPVSAKAISIRPPDRTTLPSAGRLAASDLATQDTVALSTGRVRRRGGPAWAPAVLSACVLAGAAAGAWAFLVRAPAQGTPVTPSAEPAATSEATAPSTPAVPEIPAAAAGSPSASALAGAGSASSAQVAAAPRPAATANPKTAAPGPSGAAGSPAPKQPINTGAAVPHCMGLLGVACSAEYKAIDYGNQCARTQATIQSMLTASASELSSMNAACKGQWMAAVQVLSERRRAQAQAKP
jgi:predicted Ser/Thr protein kinase